ncbi:aminotransferase class I/II-fold pyridoxal phosphate-dependent enzyme [Lentimicrobium sp.]|uniref:aminotransferase class I/II-fold pyridoxal phosphate-dependent enzyme n=1 Tax=Lentimicrobium sp. TaxID=2034841 RepID=UPI0025E3096E|nr:aminotransferase class I/II-fold pyridoxal phosphate-dependent enzyme [Lentimicrobium sp.]MCO5255415.1 aminotransferase class I/II-fold pyridoxal phosphate-dependent enzyme [Lentimicrobium sp.]MCO5261722.1 aminotransferase class I/II-fold pyridoxal phosphate-dependent enzyme [Lentimicrobium sp.]HOP13905.1 aminotransferase class I/II-fold pyridoxal phosphate-dependent enzyme [Lentimicrobium sp.]HPF63244.1 aminotransferase class I/II-fold pyridoxal phosphate-dependent enzyme [Lentimicrobium sp
MVDIFDKRVRNLGPLGMYAKQADGYFMFPKLEGEIGNHMKFRGKDVLVWSLNNYLGLANHPEVREVDAKAAKDWGLAYPMGARMMSGQTVYHEQLERELAAFVGKEDAFLLNFGYQGMVSIIDSLVDRHDAIVYDSEAHACIIDGARLHMGKRFVFPHNNMENLKIQLQRAKKLTDETGGGILVITEGVYGMTGDQGNLRDIVALKKEFNFRLLVDDAHGFGTMGPTGAGTHEEQGVMDGVDIYFGTFAKAMAGIGAFVATNADIVDYLRHNMRSQTFAKSLPMPMVIGSLKRLELIRKHPEMKNNLWKIVNALQSGLREAGFNLGNAASPVTPVILEGGIPEATQITVDLRENYNIFCSIVTYPVVPKGVILLRLIPTAVHTLEDVSYTINAYKELRQKLNEGAYANVMYDISKL